MKKLFTLLLFSIYLQGCTSIKLEDNISITKDGKISLSSIISLVEDTDHEEFPAISLTAIGNTEFANQYLKELLGNEVIHAQIKLTKLDKHNLKLHLKIIAEDFASFNNAMQIIHQTKATKKDELLTHAATISILSTKNIDGNSILNKKEAQLYAKQISQLKASMSASRLESLYRKYNKLSTDITSDEISKNAFSHIVGQYEITYVNGNKYLFKLNGVQEDVGELKLNFSSNNTEKCQYRHATNSVQNNNTCTWLFKYEYSDGKYIGPEKRAFAYFLH